MKTVRDQACRTYFMIHNLSKSKEFSIQALYIIVHIYIHTHIQTYLYKSIPPWDKQCLNGRFGALQVIFHFRTRKAPQLGTPSYTLRCITTQLSFPKVSGLELFIVKVVLQILTIKRQTIKYHKIPLLRDQISRYIVRSYSRHITHPRGLVHGPIFLSLPLKTSLDLPSLVLPAQYTMMFGWIDHKCKTVEKYSRIVKLQLGFPMVYSIYHIWFTYIH